MLNMVQSNPKGVEKTASKSEQDAWTLASARLLYDLPFNDLLFEAQNVHRANFDPNRVQLSKLLNIKTGGCPEDCGYCSQSAHHASGLKASKLMSLDTVLEEAQKAKDSGATRYCMGAAWRSPKPRDEPAIAEMVKQVKALGLETCMTLGMLSPDQAQTFAEAGLDYYNHNIDTSERFYPQVITTRSFDDRLETLAHVREAGIKVCSGGILGLGETEDDRIDMLVTLANLPTPPESVPINMLIPMPGSRLEKASPVDPIAFVRIIALARLMMPQSHVRLTAGRNSMSDEMQALCFFAGANSIFIGDTLLTAANPGEDRDTSLMRRLGLTADTLDNHA
ncbi:MULTISPECIES: biotin synthase BioB [Brucella/Ochrobactrum group]|uniref:Biotin synthase n=1 Tax=Brucella anthropi (strain ATCC 49188 / DSM 6882 / CCUG 24695 / JCM 21032 / LMG 3331 / NBRC 15819 / NCTC 12168 / Alc 37) TaxID=439375 RepID=BIOB_BRUA4|nr:MULTISPECIES: biotin synthase BioB [Brucella/Ochrobactrum group]A6X2S8.1 RecName: Full=Biotin synthase [Brucella anthropi ATCC 49188]ABS15532.1 biotin synthase [Brucella anthropi ATCC 49188]KAB2735687.1 biotin synthase BioB [Brucella anthropi]KAB2751522.1 biotin synthase BioB [Brucella anthropi]KAB2761676.1 biotin synthase BioB [Brucella anthropi]KAB2777633.1 biotin synthase BioB [Brucella anthropi]